MILFLEIYVMLFMFYLYRCFFVAESESNIG